MRAASALWLVSSPGLGLPNAHRNATRRTGAVGNLDVVEHLYSAGGLRHSRGRAFVLHYRGRSRPGGDSILNVNLEAVLADLGLRQFGLDGGFDFSVAKLAFAVRLGEGAGK